MRSEECLRKQLPMPVVVKIQILRLPIPVLIWVIARNALNAAELWKMRAVVRCVRAAVIPNADDLIKRIRGLQSEGINFTPAILMINGFDGIACLKKNRKQPLRCKLLSLSI